MSMTSPRTTAGRLLLNCLCGGGLNILTALVGIFLTPYILSRMGDQRYGVWAVLGSVYAYATVLQLGLYSAINRHIPMHLAQGEERKIREVVSTTMAFFMFGGFIVLLVTLVFGDQILGVFHIPPGLMGAARIALYAVGIVAALCISLNSFGAVLSGYQRYELMALARLAGMVLRVGLVLVLLQRGESLITMALIFGATECLVGILNMVLGWRLLPDNPLRFSAVHWRVLRDMFGYGVNTFIYAVGAVAIAKTGEIIIGTYLPPEHITYYTLALMPPMMLAGFIESFVASIKPAVADLDSRNEVDRIKELAVLAQKYVLLFMLPSMAFFVIMANHFYFVWLHREMPEAVALLYILAVGYTIHAVQFPMFLVLAGRGEHRVFGVLTIAMGLAAVAFSMLLCHVFHWGTMGVAIGTTTALVIVSGVALPIHGSRRLQIPLSAFARRAWIPAFLGTSPGIVVLALWEMWQPPRTLVELAAVVISVGVLTLTSIWLLALDKTERDRFAGTAFEWIEKVAPDSVLDKLGCLRR